MGFPKALMSVQGYPAVIALTRQFCLAQVERVFLTLPRSLYKKPELNTLLHGFSVEQRLNNYDTYGYAGSIKSVLETIDQHYDGIFITPIDAPYINTRMLHLMAAMANKKPQSCIIVPNYYARNGHPVYFSQDYFRELLNCHLYGGLHKLIQQHNKSVKVLLWADKNILVNLNNYSADITCSEINL